MAPTTTRPRPAGIRSTPRGRSRAATSRRVVGPDPRRVARNFALMSGAELACRATSVAVTLSLTRSLGKAGYGRVEFAFNVVFWLVLLVRDGSEVIAARELARHPRLVRPLVNHLMALKGLLAVGLYGGLLVVGFAGFSGDAERTLLALYGLMLLTTALGLDYVYRGLERMGIVALSLVLRTSIYAAGVWCGVGGPSGIARVPAWLVIGEAIGIGLVWTAYVREHGWPRPTLGRRFLGVFLRRGRTVVLIQLAQTVLASIDLMIVGALYAWGETGLFGAPHRMVTAILTFGLIFQQVVFPTLARSWREGPGRARQTLDAAVRVLVLGLLPMAVGATVLAGPLVALLFPGDYAPASTLLAVGVWRAPLLSLAFLYQTALIALNRERAGVGLLLIGAAGSGPLVLVLSAGFGLAGAASAVGLTALALAAAGYLRLVNEGLGPAWHHHLARPLIASVPMVGACLALKSTSVPVAVVSGAVAYGVTLVAVGGLRRDDLAAVLGRA